MASLTKTYAHNQVDSFETMLDIPMLGSEPFPAVFIRAPVVDTLLDPSKASPLPEGVTVVEEDDPADPLRLVKAGGAGTDGLLPPKKALPIVVARSLDSYRDSAAASSLAPSAAGTVNGAAANAILSEASIANAPGASSSSSSSSTSAPSFRPPLQILAALPAPVTSPVAPPMSDAPPDTILSAPHALAREAARSKSSAPYEDDDDEEEEGRRTPTGPPKLTGLVPRPGQDNQIVALRQGNLMSTSFHPELTPDPRLHMFFLQQIVIPPLLSKRQQ